MLSIIKKHPYYIIFVIIAIIISLSVWILNESFGTGLLTFGILSLIIVSIISAYNNLD